MSTSRYPWIEQDVSDNGLYSKCINSIYIVNRKDICKERIIDSRVAVFDKYRYLVWMSDNIDYVSDEYFFPKNNELVFDLIKINSDVTNVNDSNKKCNYIYAIAVYDLYENFVWTIDKNNTILVYEKDLLKILNNNNINIGVAYCAIPPKINNFYKKIRISSLNSLKNTTIELYKYNDNIFVKQFIASNLDNTDQNFIMPNVKNILESKLLKKMSIQITDKHCLPMFDGKLTFKLINERYTSKMCSCCGNLGGADIYTCQECHMTIDRDINGARNIYVKSLLLKTNVI